MFRMLYRPTQTRESDMTNRGRTEETADVEETFTIPINVNDSDAALPTLISRMTKTNQSKHHAPAR